MKTAIIILTLSITPQVFSQTGVVGINTSTPNDKSILEVYTKNTGVLLTRLTTAERDQIVLDSSVNGLIVYNTDEKCFNFYRASKNAWKKMCGTTGNPTAKNQLLN